MNGTQIGSLYVAIGAEMDGVKKALESTEQLMNHTAGTMQSAGSRITSEAKKLGSSVVAGADDAGKALSRMGNVAASLAGVGGLGLLTGAVGIFGGALRHGVDLAMQQEDALAKAGSGADTLSKQLDKAKGQVDKLSLGLGQALMPALQESAEAMNELFSSSEMEEGVASLALAIRTDLVPALMEIPSVVREAGIAWGELDAWLKTTNAWIQTSTLWAHEKFFGWMPEFGGMWGQSGNTGLGSMPGQGAGWAAMRNQANPIPDWVSNIPQST